MTPIIVLSFGLHKISYIPNSFFFNNDNFTMINCCTHFEISQPIPFGL